MQTGVVKWFNNAKGYGFILSENSSGDIFAHYSAIKMDGYKTLKAGQKVRFTTEDGPKGIHAIDIQTIDENAAGSSDRQTGQNTAQQNTKSNRNEQELA